LDFYATRLRSLLLKSYAILLIGQQPKIGEIVPAHAGPRKGLLIGPATRLNMPYWEGMVERKGV
jgi:hypothetical protein